MRLLARSYPRLLAADYPPSVLGDGAAADCAGAAGTAGVGRATGVAVAAEGEVVGGGGWSGAPAAPGADGGGESPRWGMCAMS